MAAGRDQISRRSYSSVTLLTSCKTDGMKGGESVRAFDVSNPSSSRPPAPHLNSQRRLQPNHLLPKEPRERNLVLRTRVPDLSLYGLVVHLNRPGGKLDSNRRLGVKVELVPSESTEHCPKSRSKQCQIRLDF